MRVGTLAVVNGGEEVNDKPTDTVKWSISPIFGSAGGTGGSGTQGSTVVEV